MSRTSTETSILEVPERDTLVDEVTLHTCLRNCMGTKDMAAGCCTLGDRDYIIGPIPDAQALLDRLSALWKRKVPYKEVFIDYAEGRALFPKKSQWQRKECFPALRVNTKDKVLGCMFLTDCNLCSIHEIRSVTCANYSCTYLKDITDRL